MRVYYFKPQYADCEYLGYSGFEVQHRVINKDAAQLTELFHCGFRENLLNSYCLFGSMFPLYFFTASIFRYVILNTIPGNDTRKGIKLIHQWISLRMPTGVLDPLIEVDLLRKTALKAGLNETKNLYVAHSKDCEQMGQTHFMGGIFPLNPEMSIADHRYLTSYFNFYLKAKTREKHRSGCGELIAAEPG